ncbi:MAG: M43 family zinc metalloprotease [Bacteroidales bacterium]
MKKLLTFSFWIFMALGTFAQSGVLYPADDVLLKNAVATDPELIDRYVAYEADFESLMNSAKTDTLIGGKRIIPVVFHIIHTYGAENISDDQVYDALEKLNTDYNLQNADTADIFPLFKSRAANCQIEFRLARIDTNGNCTSGIIHHFDPQTNFAYFNTMAKYCWTPSKYMNIFAVNFIYPEGMSLPDGAFIGGMTPFTPSNTLTQALTGGDTLMVGVLIRQDCIGTIGTAADMAGMGLNLMNRTFTHETGHYFNLYHPFQSMYAALGIDGCGMPPLFETGDEVDDTPPVAAATQNTSLSCFVPGSINSCTTDSPDEPDMIENYMDYQWGYCTNMFSLGQLDRINTTLMNDRRNLWSYENLVATGVFDTNAVLCAPVADFHAEAYTICAGNTVTFHDVSYNGAVASRTWSFAGGSPSTSTDQTPVVTYAAPGVYAVTLKVYNATGNDSLTRVSYIHVMDPSVVTVAPLIESFETINFNSDLTIHNDTGAAWAQSASACTGAKAIYLNNFDGNVAGSYDAFITPAYDLSGLGEHTKLQFRCAYAPKFVAGSLLAAADTVYDKLTVYFSNDCGETWVNKLSLTGNALASASPAETAFNPASEAEWGTHEIILPQGTLSGYANLRVKFEFYSNGGNNVFIDDINIHPNSWFGVNESIVDNSFAVYPNPAGDETNISFTLHDNANVKLSVLDITGREITVITTSNLDAGAHRFPLSLNQVKAKGTYFIRLEVNGMQMVKTVVF